MNRYEKKKEKDFSLKKIKLGSPCETLSETHQWGPVSEGAHVPCLNFTASYVAISEHSRIACRNFINNSFSSLPVWQSPFAATKLREHTASIFSTFKPRVSPRSFFFSRGCFFRVSLDGLSERGTTRSLHEIAAFFKMPLPHFTDYNISVNSN